MVASLIKSWAVPASLGVHLALGASVMALRPEPAPVAEEPIAVVILSAPSGGGRGGGGSAPVAPPPAPRPPKPRRPPPPPPLEKPQPVVAEESKVEVAAPVEEPVETPPEEVPVEGEAPSEEASEAPASEGAAAAGGSGEGTGSGFGSGLGDAVDVKVAAYPPKLRESKSPEYPRRARAQNIEGLVVLRIVVDREGRVEPELTKVLRSVPALDAAAIEAVHEWRFAPARDENGRPIRVIVQLPVRFSLH